jgi:hypothetical protein
LGSGLLYQRGGLLDRHVLHRGGGADAEPDADSGLCYGINEAAIEKARRGTYLDTITADVSPERLSRFFVREASRACCFNQHVISLMATGDCLRSSVDRRLGDACQECFHQGIYECEQGLLRPADAEHVAR